MQSPPEPDWPYSSTSSAGFPAAGHRSTTDPGQYALAGGSMLPPSTVNSYSVQAPARAQALDASSTPYTAGFPRQPFSVNYPSLDPASSQYGLQSTRHGFPLQMSHAPPTNYPSAEYSPQWTSLASHSRPLPSTYSFETEVPSSYQSTELSYGSHGGLPYAAGATESTSVFPGLSPLASTLPFSGPSRTLPNPTNVQSSYSGSGTPILESDSGLGSYSQHLASRNPISIAARDAINASEGSNSTASSSPSDTHRSSNAGYGNHSYSSQVGSNASASSLPSGGVSRRVSNEETYAIARAGAQPSHSGNSHLPNLNSTYGIQNMPGAFAAQNEPIRSMTSGGSMLGGLPSNIHQPLAQHSRSQDMPPILKGTFDLTSRGARRRSNSRSKGQKQQGKR